MHKLTEDEVDTWFREIRLAQEWRKPYEQVWDRVIDYLKGRYFSTLSEEDRICVNMVRPHVNVVIPAIYSKNPDVVVLPRKLGEPLDDLVRKRAEVMQNLLRYYLKELDIKTEVKLCILDAVLTGHAWVKTGYETEFATDTEGEAKPKTLISDFLSKLGIKQPNGQDDTEDEFYSNEKIISERPWALRTSPFDMFVPMLSRRPEELYWLDERIILPYDTVMDNEEYDTKDLKPSANANGLLAKLRGADYTPLKYANDIKYCILHEIWDAKTKNIYTLCEGHTKALQCKESEYTFLDTKYHPYVQLRFGEVTDEFYPQGDIEPAEPQIKELNEIRTQMVRHRKRYNRRYISRPGALDPQAKADLKLGDDGTVVEVAGDYRDDPIEDIVQPITDAPLPVEVYQVETRIKDDLFTILGTADYASRAQGGARTATEASIIATQSRFRVEERIDAIGMFVERIIRNLAMMAQKFMDNSAVGNVLGIDGQMFWQQLSDRKDIQGEYNYNVVYGSTTPINRDTKREDFDRFYILAKDDPYYDQAKLRLQLVREHGLENPEQWLNTQVAAEIEKQRMLLIKQGYIAGPPTNPLGSARGVAGTPGQGATAKLPTGQPSGLPGDLGGEAVPLPGGTGGTALA